MNVVLQVGAPIFGLGSNPLTLDVCLTCSSVSGSQYMQGAAFVFRNRSSRSFAGGSSAAFSAEGQR